MQTIEQIKENLPAVVVITGNRRFVASVKGRKNDFATIVFELGRCDISFEVSWQLVVRAVNEKIDIRYN